MRKKIGQLITGYCLLIILTVSSSAYDIENKCIATSERSSLLGSPENWLMGPATGFPSMLGWRIERYWQLETKNLPSWVVSADIAIVIPCARLCVERQIQNSKIYAGFGGRVFSLPVYGFTEESTFYSLSIPFSYRSGASSDKWTSHISLSAEIYTHDYNEWHVLPALQISFVNKM